MRTLTSLVIASTALVFTSAHASDLVRSKPLVRSVSGGYQLLLSETDDAQIQSAASEDQAPSQSNTISVIDPAPVKRLNVRRATLTTLIAEDPDASASMTDSSPTASGGSIQNLQNGDINADGFVNIDDLLLVLEGWGSCSADESQICSADLTGDQLVDISDLVLVLSHWSLNQIGGSDL